MQGNLLRVVCVEAVVSYVLAKPVHVSDVACLARQASNAGEVDAVSSATLVGCAYRSWDLTGEDQREFTAHQRLTRILFFA